MGVHTTLESYNCAATYDQSSITTNISYISRTRLPRLDTPTLFSGLNAWIVVFDVEHEEYLEAADLTLYVGTIPTWLASDILA